jgi:hypothetical protein
MDVSVVLGDAGGGAGVVAAIAAVAALLHRRRRLMYRLVSVTPLVSIEPTARKLVVLYGGARVDQPYSCFFELENRGSNDITSDDFEGHKSLGFRLGSAKIMGVSSEPGSEWLASATDTAPSAISIRPVLLPAHRRATLGLVTDGRPEISWDGTPVLRNTQVCSWRRLPW